MIAHIFLAMLTGLSLAVPCAIEAKSDQSAARVSDRVPDRVSAREAAPGNRSMPTSGQKFASFKRPFAADSPWNSAPIKPVLDQYVLPKTAYYPFYGTGPYTTGVFEARTSDAAVTVKGLSNPDGVWHTDEGQFKNVTVPRWPPDVLPAAGTDGHADIVDAALGLVHSFWQLRNIDGEWRATQYAWTALAGRGWSDPAHNHQGARAAGVPTMAGLIRKHELDNGDHMFRHVVAITLDGSALRKGYVFPATAEDDNAAQNYRGGVPMGSLLMLPADFDVAALRTPALRKLAETLKYYGGAVVDQNHDTRFTIPIEQGARFDLHAMGWDSAAGDDLNAIADALRRVVSVDGWLDGNGRKTTPRQNLNLLSMRGPWTNPQGGPAGRFDSWQQSLHFEPAVQTVISQQIAGKSQRMTRWAPWQAGQSYAFSVQGGGGARLRLQFRAPDNEIIWETSNLANGQHHQFVMPAQPGMAMLVATSGIGQASWVRGNLLAKLAAPTTPCSVETENCRTPASLRKP